MNWIKNAQLTVMNEQSEPRWRKDMSTLLSSGQDRLMTFLYFVYLFCGPLQ